MKKHTKIYYSFFNYDQCNFIPCEVCGDQAIDIHHIECRGMGGTKQLESIDNLMALCRSCHLIFGDKKQHKDVLKEIHSSVIAVKCYVTKS